MQHPLPIKKALTISIVLLATLGSTFTTIEAQSTCTHLDLEYDANPNYFAIGVENLRQEESEWSIVITDAQYKLDPSQFSMPDGVTLTIQSTQTSDSTITHVLTPDRPIEGFQSLNFEYDPAPEAINQNYDADVILECISSSNLCNGLDFSIRHQTSSSFGFIVQNNTSETYNHYEVHIDNATYHIDTSLLSHDGFDVIIVENDDDTFDYYFIPQAPLEGFTNSPTVRISQDFGIQADSDGFYIRCGDNVVSSALNGGLESHGALASKIALRNFRRAIGQPIAPSYKNNNSDILNLVPEKLLSGDKLVESTPTDLIELTGAEAIWAGDYLSLIHI